MRSPIAGRPWLSGLVWFSFPIAIVAAAIPHLLSGIVLESVFPVPIYLAMNVSLPTETYKAAAKGLARIADGDGNAGIVLAEAMLNAGEPIEATMPVLERGLSRSPSSARGWMLLAELRAHDPQGAGQALALSFALAPSDYWLAGRRLCDAAKLWTVLPIETRNQALLQVRLLWNEPLLRPQIEPLIATKGGPEMFTKAFHNDLDALRALNRWRASVRRSQFRDEQFE